VVLEGTSDDRESGHAGSGRKPRMILKCPECGRSLQMQRATALWKTGENRAAEASQLWAIPFTALVFGVLWIIERVYFS